MIWQTNIITIAILFSIGLYCLISKKNLIKMIIGIEILARAATLSFILSGYVQLNEAITQSIAITFILLDVVVVAVALSLTVNAYKHTRTLNISALRRLRG